MAIRNVLLEGDEILRKKSKPVVNFDNNLLTIMKDLEDTMIKYDGAGLAGPQVGILKRVFVFLHNDKIIWVINPEILEQSGQNKYLAEGCLSLPDKIGEVVRPQKIKVRYQDIKGNFIEKTFSGFSAKAFCHEYDHLEGILYIDRCDKVFNNYQEYSKYKKKKQKEENN